MSRSIDTRGSVARGYGSAVSRVFSNVVHREVPVVSVAILVALFAVGLLAPFIAPYEPGAQILTSRLTGPNSSNLLGTDQLGRDVLSRIIYGARTTVIVASIGIAIGAGAGTVLGVVAGYFGGVVDAIIARMIDLMLSFPAIFFGLLFAVSFGAGLRTVVIAISLVLWARFARVIRSAVVSLRERDFISLARVVGCGHMRIMAKYVFPNIVGTLMALISINLGFVIILEATLSFLGAGIPPPRPSWGSMIADGRGYIDTAWWIAMFPGLAIFAVVLSLNAVGNWLRRAMDPQLAVVNAKATEVTETTP